MYLLAPIQRGNFFQLFFRYSWSKLWTSCQIYELVGLAKIFKNEDNFKSVTLHHVCPCVKECLHKLSHAPIFLCERRFKTVVLQYCSRQIHTCIILKKIRFLKNRNKTLFLPLFSVEFSYMFCKIEWILFVTPSVRDLMGKICFILLILKGWFSNIDSPHTYFMYTV